MIMRLFDNIKLILCFLLLTISQFTYAQQITQAEYYIDDDPGFGNGTAIDVSTPTDLLETDVAVPVNLNIGIHTLFVRTKDENGVWSLSDGRPFFTYIPYTGLITQAEFFIDGDPGFGNGTALSITNGSEINLEAELTTSSTPIGNHIVGVRTKNEQGKWSLTEFRPFHIYRSAQLPITAAEYYIGDDPGIGNGTPLPIEANGNAADINAAIDVTGMALGNYTISIRVLNQNGSWSLHEVIPFTICEFAGAISEFEFIQFNNTVSFLNNSQFAESYLWDFDDGITSTAEEPAHFFNQPGTYNIMLIATNACGIDTSYQEITISSIDDINTDKGGLGAIVTSTITGNGFMEESTVLLCKTENNDILLVPDTFLVVSSHVIMVVMNLANAELGYYDVKVINGTDTLTLIEGYEVIERVEPTFEVYITGPSVFRPDVFAGFNITIVNNGNVDALLVPVNIGNIPWSDEDGEFSISALSGDYIDPRDYDMLSEAVNDAINGGVDSLLFLGPKIVGTSDGDSATFNLGSLYPFVPPGSNSFTVQFKANQDSDQGNGEEICITVTVSPPMLKNTPTITASDCAATVLKCAMEIALELTPAGDAINCIKGVIGQFSGVTSATFGVGVADGIISTATGGQVLSTYSSKLSTKATSASAIVKTLIDCASAVGGSAFIFARFPKFVKLAYELASYAIGQGTGALTIASCVADSYTACTNISENGGTKQTFKKLIVQSSHDPNAKTGPGIVGDNYVNGFNTMSYTIQFENVDSAELAAQVVVVIDSLDVTKFDLSTFAFLDYGFGNTIIPVGTGGDDFTDILDLRPEMPNLLRVDGSIDTLSGVITWVFTTLDTITLSQTEGVFDGFLPPNVDSPEGQGFVSFGIELNESVESGDIIENNSVIIFDTNEPIVTNTWDNGFDDADPSSQVNSLPVIINDTIFDISWSGTDDASGVRWYDIYASKNDEEYQLIVSHTEDITMFLIGEYGDNYKFYSIATDKAGNVEEAPTSFDAETTLEMPTQINELTVENSWLGKAYPNPSEGNVTFVYSITESQDITLVLYDIMGRPVMVLDEGLRSGKIQFSKDLSSISNGMYYVTLFTEKENMKFTTSLIINK